MARVVKGEILLSKDLPNLIKTNTYNYKIFFIKKVVFIYPFKKASLYYLLVSLKC